MIEFLGLIAIIAAEEPLTSAIEGRWANPSRSVIIDIAPCAEALCGTVAWASEQAQQDARKGTPNLIGTALLTQLQPRGDMWEGQLFVPDERIHATAKIEAQGANQLKVSGCKIICDSQVWTRADGPLPPSD